MKKKIISFFKKNSGKKLKAKELAKNLNVSNEYDYSLLKSFLHNLVDEGTLIKEGKRYSFNNIPENNKIIGTIQINDRGFGFLIPENKKLNDIFIPEKYLNNAFNGDLVEVTLFAANKRRGKNLEGEVTNIMKRKWTEIPGTLRKSDSVFFVEPDIKEINRDIFVSKEELNNAEEGEKVIVGNIVWDSQKANPSGKILQVLGKAGSKNYNLVLIAKEFNLPYIFPDNVLKEANDINSEITEEEIKSRIDFRDKIVFTIDPEDAKDFDDAISIEQLENNNFLVSIHIADVSHYIKENIFLDKEAEKRGNSVYLVGQVIPMLPENLSNGICSLIPNEDRLTFSVIAEVSSTAKVIDYKIAKTIINSKRRFTYEEVQNIIESGEGDFKNEILLMNKLAKTLRKKRTKEGSINFTTAEAKFELGEFGEPINIIRKEMRDSNMLVEEFMLLANQVIAKHIQKIKNKKEVVPFIYRIHDTPSQEKLEEFSRFIKTLGYNYSVDALMHPSQFNKLIEEVDDKPEKDLVNNLAVRAMAKAIYSTENIGHFGLGFKYYTHFTSPIRRYSDLLVHRLLHNYLNDKSKLSYSQKRLEVISKHISDTERVAMEAERYSIKMKRTEFLKDHLGEEFDAVISGVTYFGIFVEIVDSLAEGLIHIRDLEGDFYVYDEKKYSLIGKRTKKIFRLGDKLRVKLIRADLDKNELDFLLA
ncbi:MAG: ribonuclease R [Ignavibacterium sp.]